MLKKKSQVEISLQQIIGFALAVFIVLATLALFVGLMNIFTGRPDSGSTATVAMMTDAFAAFGDPHNLNESCYIRPVYLQEDWGIVGFNADKIESASKTTWGNRITCSMGGECIVGLSGKNQIIDKPSNCGHGSCICLCNGGGAGDIDGNDCMEDNPLCKKLPLELDVTSLYQPSNDGDAWYGNTIRTTGGVGSRLKDVYLDSEGYWGGNNEAELMVVIIKAGSMEGGHKAFYIDHFPASELSKRYPDVKTDCKYMAKFFKDYQAAATAIKPAAQQAESNVTRDLREAGAVSTNQPTVVAP